MKNWFFKKIIRGKPSQPPREQAGPLDHVQHRVPHDSASQHCPQQRVDGQSPAGRQFTASIGDQSQFSKAHKYKHGSPLVTQVSIHSVCWTMRAFSQQWLLKNMYVVIKKRDPPPCRSQCSLGYWPLCDEDHVFENTVRQVLFILPYVQTFVSYGEAKSLHR